MSHTWCISVVLYHWCCITGVVSLVLYHWCCITGIVSLVLYHWCCITGVVSLVLYHWCCITGIVSLVLYHWCCITGVVSLVLYHWCCITGVVSLVFSSSPPVTRRLVSAVRPVCEVVHGGGRPVHLRGRQSRSRSHGGQRETNGLQAGPRPHAGKQLASRVGNSC